MQSKNFCPSESTKKKLNIVLVGMISSLVFLGALSSVTVVLAAKFNASMSGNNEVPPVDTKATGQTTFRTANNDTTIKYKVNITGFSDATGAMVHTGKAGANGDVIVDLLQGSKKNPTKLGMLIRGNITDSSLTGPMKGKTLADLISAIKNGDTYVNVHTSSHPNGEIRGQIESGGSSVSSSSNTTASVNATDLGNSTNTG
ncbi:MAG: CHRD domain-containing protein [Nitrososphaerota archaeon]